MKKAEGAQVRGAAKAVPALFGFIVVCLVVSVIVVISSSESRPTMPASRAVAPGKSESKSHDSERTQDLKQTVPADLITSPVVVSTSNPPVSRTARLRDGMDYATVAEILGGPGAVKSSVGSVETMLLESRVWYLPDGTLVTADFRNFLMQRWTAQSPIVEQPATVEIDTTPMVNFDDVAYIVGGVEWFDRISDGLFAYEPNAAFLCVGLGIRNDDTVPRRIENFTLMDESGSVYVETDLSLVDGFLNTGLDSLNPGVMTTGLIAFDVPREHRYVLVLPGASRHSDVGIIDLN